MKRVLVTGGSRGIGLAICRSLLMDGWDVVAMARTVSNELLDLMQTGRLTFQAFDFEQIESVRHFARHAKCLHPLDGFVANAGMGLDGLLTLTSDTAIERCIRINLIAPILLAREIVKGMMQGGGSLVFVSSAVALSGAAGLTVYSATKGGLVAFSRSVAREYGRRGVRSNAILPGFIETDMTGSVADVERRKVIRRTALGRLGQIEDVVGTVRFLLSDEARFITGTEFVVDGGACHG